MSLYFIAIIIVAAGIFLTVKKVRQHSPYKTIANIIFWSTVLISLVYPFPGQRIVLVVLLLLVLYTKRLPPKRPVLKPVPETEKTYQLSADSDNQPPLPSFYKKVSRLEQPGLFLTPFNGDPLTKVGGLPIAPLTMQWPSWKNKPLFFLCQINLNEIPCDFESDTIPRKGVLYFFYNSEQETWGIEPEDKGSWAVRYLEDIPDNLSPLQAPIDLSREGIFNEKPVCLDMETTLPPCDHPHVEAADFSEEEIERYDELYEIDYTGRTLHHMLGYAQSIQNGNMEEQCEKIYKKSLSASERSSSESDGHGKWLLLLQLDSDEETGMMWGDAGMLYFWIREDDLRERNFNDVWMILECC